MPDKSKKIYELYKSKGLIKNTDYETFSSANESQRKSLYDLGVKNGLFKTTNYETFSSSWGDPLKKKDQSTQDSSYGAQESDSSGQSTKNNAWHLAKSFANKSKKTKDSPVNIDDITASKEEMESYVDDSGKPKKDSYLSLSEEKDSQELLKKIDRESYINQDVSFFYKKSEKEEIKALEGTDTRKARELAEREINRNRRENKDLTESFRSENPLIDYELKRDANAKIANKNFIMNFDYGEGFTDKYTDLSPDLAVSDYGTSPNADVSNYLAHIKNKDRYRKAELDEKYRKKKSIGTGKSFSDLTGQENKYEINLEDIGDKEKSISKLAHQKEEIRKDNIVYNPSSPMMSDEEYNDLLSEYHRLNDKANEMGIMYLSKEEGEVLNELSKNFVPYAASKIKYERETTGNLPSKKNQELLISSGLIDKPNTLTNEFMDESQKDGYLTDMTLSQLGDERNLNTRLAIDYIDRGKQIDLMYAAPMPVDSKRTNNRVGINYEDFAFTDATRNILNNNDAYGFATLFDEAVANEDSMEFNAETLVPLNPNHAIAFKRILDGYSFYKNVEFGRVGDAVYDEKSVGSFAQNENVKRWVKGEGMKDLTTSADAYTVMDDLKNVKAAFDFERKRIMRQIYDLNNKGINNAGEDVGAWASSYSDLGSTLKRALSALDQLEYQYSKAFSQNSQVQSIMAVDEAEKEYQRYLKEDFMKDASPAAKAFMSISSGILDSAVETAEALANLPASIGATEGDPVDLSHYKYTGGRESTIDEGIYGDVKNVTKVISDIYTMGGYMKGISAISGISQAHRANIFAGSFLKYHGVNYKNNMQILEAEGITGHEAQKIASKVALAQTVVESSASMIFKTELIYDPQVRNIGIKPLLKDLAKGKKFSNKQLAGNVVSNFLKSGIGETFEEMGTDAINTAVVNRVANWGVGEDVFDTELSGDDLAKTATYTLFANGIYGGAGTYGLTKSSLHMSADLEVAKNFEEYISGAEKKYKQGQFTEKQYKDIKSRAEELGKTYTPLKDDNSLDDTQKMKVLHYQQYIKDKKKELSVLGDDSYSEKKRASIELEITQANEAINEIVSKYDSEVPTESTTEEAPEATEDTDTEPTEQPTEPSSDVTQEDVVIKDIDIKDDNVLDKVYRKLDDWDNQLKDFGDETLGIGIPIVAARAAIKGMKAAAKVGSKGIDVFNAGLEAIRSTDWYKTLTDAEKKDVDANYDTYIDQGIQERKAAEKQTKLRTPKDKITTMSKEEFISSEIEKVKADQEAEFKGETVEPWTDIQDQLARKKFGKIYDDASYYESIKDEAESYAENIMLDSTPKEVKESIQSKFPDLRGEYVNDVYKAARESSIESMPEKKVDFFNEAKKFRKKIKTEKAKSFKAGEQKGKQEAKVVEDIKKNAIDMLTNASKGVFSDPKSTRTVDFRKMMKGVKNAKTFEDVEALLDTAVDIFTKQEKANILDKINKELDPRKYEKSVGGKSKGDKFTFKDIATVNKISDYSKMDSVEAGEKSDEIFNKVDAFDKEKAESGTTKQLEKQIRKEMQGVSKSEREAYYDYAMSTWENTGLTPGMIEDVEALQFADLENQSLSELNKRLEDLKDFTSAAREAKKLENKKKSDKIKNDAQKVKEAALGNRKLINSPETQKTKDRRFFKQIFDALNPNNYLNKIEGLNGLMNQINRTKDKDALKFVADTVRKSRRAKESGLIEAFSEVTKTKKDIFGNQRKASQKMNKPQGLKPKDADYFTGLEGREIDMRGLTGDEIAQLWLLSQQPDSRLKLEKDNKYTDEIFESLDNWAAENPKVAEYATWYKNEFLPNYYNKINDVFKEVYGINMPYSSDYVPMDVEKGDQTPGTTIGAYSGNGLGTLTGRVKNRRPNGQPIAIKGMEASMYGYINDMEHFIAFEEPLRQLQRVFGNKDVRKAITQRNGDRANKLISDIFEDLQRDSARTGTRTMEAVIKLKNKGVVATLALNLPSALSQLTSIPAYAARVNTARYVQNAVPTSGMIKDLIDLSQSDFIKSRMDTGWDRDAAAEMAKDYQRAFSLGSKFSVDKLMFLTKWGDAGAILAGGTPLYRTKYKEYIKKGMPVDKAKEKAYTDFTNATEEAQQSSYVENLSAFQRDKGAGNLLTTYMSSPMMYFQQTRDAVRNIQRGRGDINDMKRLIMYNATLPLLFTFFKGAFDMHEDEEDQEDAVKNILMGPINGMPFIAPVANYGVDKLLLNKPYGAPKPPGIDRFLTAFEKGSRIMNKKEVSQEEVVQDIFFPIMESFTGVPLKNIKKLTYDNYMRAQGEKEYDNIFNWLGYSDYKTIGDAEKKSKPKKKSKKPRSPYSSSGKSAYSKSGRSAYSKTGKSAYSK